MGRERRKMVGSLTGRGEEEVDGAWTTTPLPLAAAGNRAVNEVIRRLTTHDGVAIEDAEDEAVPSVPQPLVDRRAGAAPLLLLDRSWRQHEEEQEQRDQAAGLAASGVVIEDAEDEAAPVAEGRTGPPLLLLDRSWRQHEHEQRGAAAAAARLGKAKVRGERRTAQEAAPRSATRSPGDADRRARLAGNAAHDGLVGRNEFGFASGGLTSAIASADEQIARLDAAIAGAVAGPAAASFAPAEVLANLTTDRATLQAALDGVRRQRTDAAASSATLSASSSAGDLAAAHGLGRVAPLGVAVEDALARVAEARRAHLSPSAVRTTVQALLDAAKADAARQLGHAKTVEILRDHKGKVKATIEGEIAAAVTAQHHPPLRTWLELLQMRPASGGKLRIKSTRNVSAGMTGRSFPSHLSIYIDQATLPAAGVAATASVIRDAIFPSKGVVGAHVTLEYKGQIAPKDNPHAYRGGPTVSKSYPEDATWAFVSGELERILEDELAAVLVRIEGFTARKGRAVNDV